MTKQETTKTSRLARHVQPLSLIVAGLWVLFDELSKHWAVNRLSGDRMVDVAGSLRFNLSYNSGMAFGKGKGFGPLLGVVALIVVVYVLIGLRTGASRWSAVAVGLVLGGAAGNLCDRLFRGRGWFRAGATLE